VFARVAGALLTQLGIPTEPLLVQTPTTRTATTAPTAKPDSQPQRKASADAAGTVANAGDEELGDSVVQQEGRLLVPDLHGLTVAEVKRVVSSAPVELEVFGRGRAVAQEPDPGTVLSDRRTRLRVRFVEPGGEG